MAGEVRDPGCRTSWKISYPPYRAFPSFAKCARAFVKLHIRRILELFPKNVTRDGISRFAKYHSIT